MNSSDGSIGQTGNTGMPLLAKQCRKGVDHPPQQQERGGGSGEGGGAQLPKSLVVDGRTLSLALQSDLKPLFLDVAKRCSSVICCRATPHQKVTRPLDK